MSDPEEEQIEYAVPPFTDSSEPNDNSQRRVELSSFPPIARQKSLTINIHGIIGIVAISLMVASAFLHQWNIDLPYFILAIFLYSIVLISHSVSKEEADIRLMIGYHTAFLLLTGGMWLNIGGFFGQAGIFVAAIAVGLALPFLIVRRR